MKELTIESFEGCVGDVFKVYYGEKEPFLFELSNVSPLGRVPEEGEERRQSFSLLFQLMIPESVRPQFKLRLRCQLV